EQSVKNIQIDSLAVWEGKDIKSKVTQTEDKKKKINSKELAKTDAENRKFMPRGAILRVNLNEEHWLSFGVGDKIPVFVSGSSSFLSKRPVQTVGRFSDAKNLRLSGLLWPEYKERLEHSAYVTRESSGSGQIILFSFEPNFRSCFYSTARLLSNSILLGPGFGARQTVEW
ncbi:hypothetical protein ACFLS9_10010, partial [Bacteroidota bacterium]